MGAGSMAFAIAFLASVPFFLELELRQSEEFDKVEFLQEEAENPDSATQIYDFVIVGAGTSGCILANRLSEKYRVLLLDAGTTPPSLIQIPALYPQIENFKGGFNYFYNSIPQSASYGRVLTCSVGKMLGGSYSHNAMVFNRGSRYDYDNWAKILQDESFSYKKMLKYFKKLENYMGDYPGPDHGTKGLIPVETDTQPASATWFAAGRELGYPTADPNSVPRNMFTPIEMSRYKGRRCTTYTQYIEPILNTRANLKVIRLAVVDRVIFEGNQASGLVYHRHGKEFKVMAKKEVILTAGTFGTAFILFKSGLGPQRILEAAKIPLIKALPIGESFEDHPTVSIHFTYTDPSKFHTLYSNLTAEKLEKYLRGEPEDVLSKTSVGPQAFLASKLADKFDGRIWPDLQFVLYGSDDPKMVPNGTNTIGVVNSRPAYTKNTIGKVKLNTELYRKGVRESTKLALIDYKVFQNEHINNVLAEGLSIAAKIVETDAFKAIGAKLVPFELCLKQYKFKTDEYWKCFIKNNIGIDRHPVGTCRMGRSDQTQDYGSVDDDGGGSGGGVVNTKFQVLGVSRLRVADASVIPKITSANINAAVAAMAEKAAEQIKSDYEVRRIRRRRKVH